MLTKRPDFSKFKGDEQALQNGNKAYQNGIFGGSVFLPIGKKNGKRDKYNPLENEIKSMQVDYLYGGGYYQVCNVKEEPEVPEIDEEQVDEYGDQIQPEYQEPLFWDISMLVERVDQLDDLQSIRQLEQQAPGNKTAEIIPLEKIQKSLDGYGRILKYRVIDEEQPFSDLNCELVYVVEGKFKNGLMDGYCRLIDTQTEEVHVGYFKEDVPMGKYSRYTIAGEIQEQGIKEEDELVKDIEINNFMSRILDTKRDKMEDSLLNPGHGIKNKAKKVTTRK